MDCQTFFDLVLNSHGLQHIAIQIYEGFDKRTFKASRLASKQSKAIADSTINGLRLKCRLFRSRAHGNTPRMYSGS